MKAYVLHDINKLQLEEVKEPEIKEREVLVAVKAVGICGSDIPRVYKTGTYSYPLIIGHEFSGEVVKQEEHVDGNWVGKRVGIFPLIPCKQCVPCLKKQYEMCRNYSYLGSRRNGGFAQYVAVPEENLLALPENVSFEEAAMLEPMAVAVHAMRGCMPKLEDTVIICGLGTIGLLLLMFLKEAGIQNILAIGNKEFQKQMVINLGLEESAYCDSRTEDVDAWIMEHTNGSGADVFFECVGKNETLTRAVNHTMPAGRIMLVGNPYSDMTLEKSVYWKILRNQLEIHGTWNSSFLHEKTDDWNYVLERLNSKSISCAELITHQFSLEDLEQGFHIMRDKSEDYVKVMCVL